MHRFISGKLFGRQAIPPDFAEQMFRLRYEVFHQRLQWEVPVAGGQERDEYDDEHATYVLGIRETDRKVVATSRVRSTDHPYMLRDTFPMLLQGRQAPDRQTTWEVSRLAIDRSPASGEKTAASLSHLTRLLFAHTIRLASENGITEGIWVTTPAVERMTARMGYGMRRWSDPVDLGAARGVVQHVPIDSRSVGRALEEISLSHRHQEAA